MGCSRFVVNHHGFAVFIHQQQIQDADQHEFRGQAVIGV
jgi:hypothetical protein